MVELKGAGNRNHFPIPRVRGADPRASGRMGGPTAREGTGLGASPGSNTYRAVLTLGLLSPVDFVAVIAA